MLEGIVYLHATRDNTRFVAIMFDTAYVRLNSAAHTRKQDINSTKKIDCTQEERRGHGPTPPSQLLTQI